MSFLSNTQVYWKRHRQVFNSLVTRVNKTSFVTSKELALCICMNWNRDPFAQWLGVTGVFFSFIVLGATRGATPDLHPAEAWHKPWTDLALLRHCLGFLCSAWTWPDLPWHFWAIFLLICWTWPYLPKPYQTIFLRTCWTCVHKL